MSTCIIDGKEAKFEKGENLVEVAKRIGIDIPVFCYHAGLSIVAQCRMCTVDIEKMPKLQTACSTAAQEGMVVHTKSERVIKNRDAVMEFLLINHPLDCPICDKSGECDLQDFSFQHGSAYMRSMEERRTYMDLDMGPIIKKNMNRCIHCTRCIRFGDEVAGIREMVALKRGNNVEITTLDGRPLETEYAGNYADICPTGSLTLHDFRFHKRAWMLKKTPSICEGCSRGCNLEIHHDRNQMQRCMPRTNMEINKHWLCDEGRFNFRYVQNENRVVTPLVRNEKASWEMALDEAKNLLGRKKGFALIGSDLTQEEVQLLQQFLPTQFSGIPMAHFGTPGVTTSKEDADADAILKRKSKTSNLHGLEKLGLSPFKTFPSGTQAVVVFTGGRAILPDLQKLPAVGVGFFNQTNAQAFQVVLPGPAFAEKEGTVVNFQMKEQRLQRAVVPPRTCKSLSEVLMLWMNRKGVSVSAAAGVA